MSRRCRYIVLRDVNARLRLEERIAPEVGGVVRSLSEVPPEPRVESDDMAPSEAQRLAQNDPEVLGVARAMPTRLIEPRDVDGVSPGSMEGGTAWGVSAVGALASPFDGADVRVAVLDTGIDAGHPAFAGVALTQRDFTDGGGDVARDGNGHGTHCAGTIFGRDVQGVRIGVARSVSQALIGKVLGDDGSGSSERLFEAPSWTSQNRAKVISMSLGFDFPGLSQQLVEEFDMPVILATSVALEGYRANLRMFDRIMDVFRAQSAFDGGRVVVAASGNESERQIDPDFEVSASVPSAAEGVISVGALGRSAGGALVVAPFSNTAPILSAPGVDIVSAAAGGGLDTLSGTSMACPHAAGVAALWWQAIGQTDSPTTSRAVEARMLASARRDVFVPGTDVADRGFGLVTAPSAQLS